MYKNIIINDIESLIEDIISNVIDNNVEYTIIAKYNEASAIIIELLEFEETSALSLNIWNEKYESDKEFIITINNHLGIECNPIYCNNDYIPYKTDKIFIMDDCFSKFIKYCPEDNIFIINYTNELDGQE